MPVPQQMNWEFDGRILFSPTIGETFNTFSTFVTPLPPTKPSAKTSHSRTNPLIFAILRDQMCLGENNNNNNYNNRSRSRTSKDRVKTTDIPPY